MTIAMTRPTQQSLRMMMTTTVVDLVVVVVATNYDSSRSNCASMREERPVEWVWVDVFSLYL